MSEPAVFGLVSGHASRKCFRFRGPASQRVPNRIIASPELVLLLLCFFGVGPLCLPLTRQTIYLFDGVLIPA